MTVLMIPMKTKANMTLEEMKNMSCVIFAQKNAYLKAYRASSEKAPGAGEKRKSSEPEVFAFLLPVDLLKAWPEGLTVPEALCLPAAAEGAGQGMLR